jgi:polar amino acid transport system substrate-binding protein
MRLSKKVLATVAAGILTLSLVLVGCGGGGAAASGEIQLIKDGVITVGSDCDYPPFITMENGKPAGFEYDLLVAIGEELGYTIEYLEPQNFDQLLASLAAGNSMDVACSSFTINDERKEIVDFTDSYFDSNQAVVVKTGASYDDASDLAGLRVGAQAGTTGEDWAVENISNVQMVPLNDATGLFVNLESDSVQAIVLDEPTARNIIAENYSGKMKVLEVIATGEQYGIAVAKSNPALTQAINDALATLRSNGTYQQIYNKYIAS